MKNDIYEEIRRRILFLEYSPGERLDEKELATEFGTSRTPIREVLLRLQWQKLVTILPRAGITVTKLEFQQVRDLYLIRLYLEGLVGKMAATNVTNDQLHEMEELKEKWRKNADMNSPQELIQFDIEFRELINRATGSDILKDLSDSLYMQTLRVWYLIFDRNNFQKEADALIEEIEKTIEILSKRDAQEAEDFRRKIIISYIERAKTYFLENL